MAGMIESLLAQETMSWAETLTTQIWIWARVALGIGFVIFVHELGHFLAAKWCGVKVEKFYVGFDVPIRLGPIHLPRSLARFRYGETEYGIGTIPLGGYVKMLGQDDDPRKAEAEAKRVRTSSDPAGDEEVSTLDPRSFPAKPVWQRMVIISSGVVMNLITGVMFAMVAFAIGVPYMPAVIGEVSPGGPAYQAGIEPGGKVVGVGGITGDYQLHFREMQLAIMTEGMDNPDKAVDVSLEYPDGVREYQLKTSALSEKSSRRIIGIMMPSSTRLDKLDFAQPGSASAAVLSPEDAGAQIIAINGEKLPGDGEVDNVEASIAMRQALRNNAEKPITLTLRRANEATVDVTIASQAMLMPGIRFQVGPVKAVVKDGVAEKAGVQVGDRLVAVDGDRDIDAFSLPMTLRDASKTTRVSFLRGQGNDAKEVELELVPAAEPRGVSPYSEMDNSIALSRFDFAFESTAIVTGIATPEPSEVEPIDPKNVPLQNGDVIRSFAVRWPGDKVPELFAEDDMSEVLKKLTTGWELDDQTPLNNLVRWLQLMPAGTQFKVMAARNGRIFESQTTLQPTSTPWIDRGLNFAGIERVQIAGSVGEAFSLGVREGKRRMGDVFGFLRLLVQGKVESNQVGGPITIFRVAGAETTRGITPLLMFLTLLSMNLAILNFLPIPALDGGHMVFLIAEAILGRPVDEKLQMQLTMVGVLALLSLMAFAVFNDVRQLY